MTLTLLELASVALGVLVGRYLWSVIAAILLFIAGIGAVLAIVICVAVLGAVPAVIGVFVGLFVLAEVVSGLVLLLPFVAGVATGIALRKRAAPARLLARSRRRRIVDPRPWEQVKGTVLGSPATTPDARQGLLAQLAERAARAGDSEPEVTAIMAAGRVPVAVPVSR